MSAPEIPEILDPIELTFGIATEAYRANERVGRLFRLEQLQHENPSENELIELINRFTAMHLDQIEAGEKPSMDELTDFARAWTRWSMEMLVGEAALNQLNAKKNGSISSLLGGLTLRAVSTTDVPVFGSITRYTNFYDVKRLAPHAEVTAQFQRAEVQNARLILAQAATPANLTPDEQAKVEEGHHIGNVYYMVDLFDKEKPDVRTAALEIVETAQIDL